MYYCCYLADLCLMLLTLPVSDLRLFDLLTCAETPWGAIFVHDYRGGNLWANLLFTVLFSFVPVIFFLLWSSSIHNFSFQQKRLLSQRASWTYLVQLTKEVSSELKWFVFISFLCMLVQKTNKQKTPQTKQTKNQTKTRYLTEVTIVTPLLGALFQ